MTVVRRKLAFVEDGLNQRRSKTVDHGIVLRVGGHVGDSACWTRGHLLPARLTNDVSVGTGGNWNFSWNQQTNWTF